MKLVTAIIRENQLEQVHEALIQAEISRITVSRVAGHGRNAQTEIYRGKKVAPGLIPKVRLDIALNDEFVDITVDTIIKVARAINEDEKSGQVGDGKIWITPIEECIRIRTGERGIEAI